MKKSVKRLAAFLMVLLMMTATVLPVLADEETTAAATETTAESEDVAQINADAKTTTGKAYAAAAVIIIASGVGAFAMSMVIGKSADGIARQPEAGGNIQSTMMLGLVFIETAIIYALIVAILIVFVL